MKKTVRLVVFVPTAQADVVRQAMDEVGAGQIGNYSFCSFSVKGMGRFKPNDQANPTVGERGALNTVGEERIEVTCAADEVKNVIAAIRRVHPYEEVPIDVYPVIDITEF